MTQKGNRGTCAVSLFFRGMGEAERANLETVIVPEPSVKHR